MLLLILHKPAMHSRVNSLRRRGFTLKDYFAFCSRVYGPSSTQRSTFSNSICRLFVNVKWSAVHLVGPNFISLGALLCGSFKIQNWIPSLNSVLVLCVRLRSYAHTLHPCTSWWRAVSSSMTRFSSLHRWWFESWILPAVCPCWGAYFWKCPLGLMSCWLVHQASKEPNVVYKRTCYTMRLFLSSSQVAAAAQDAHELIAYH